jgi:molybdopterin-guanine dinucleotide biosynthesis protein A
MEPKRSSRDFLFHPFEISFCGYSNSGKTTLIEKIVERWAQQELRVSYLKHDAHRFEMDHPGKDTMRVRMKGAFQVLIHNGHLGAMVGRQLNPQASSSLFLDADVLIVEGYKNLDLPKIVVLDWEQRILELFKERDDHQIVGFVGPWESSPQIFSKPYCHWNDLDGIDQLIQKFWKEKKSKHPLKGVVLAGGLSRRMGADKGLLIYNHHQTQLEFCFKLLGEFCEQVYLSVRADQSDHPVYGSYPQVLDRFLGFGPLGGILSAFQMDPVGAYLVLAVDLPGIRRTTLNHLVTHRDEKRFATCFVTGINQFKEPLCTIYEPKSFPKLLEALAMGIDSPNAFLHRVYTKDLLLGDERRDLLNINTPEDKKNFLDSRDNGVKDDFFVDPQSPWDALGIDG